MVEKAAERMTVDKGTARSSIAPFLGTLAAMVMAVFVPSALVYLTPAPYADTWHQPLFVAVLVSLRYGWVVASANRRPFEMVLWLFFYIFFGLAPLVQMRMQIDPSTTPNVIDRYYGQATAIVLVGTVAAMIGSHFGQQRREPLRGRLFQDVVRPERVTVLAGITLFLAAGYVIAVGPATLFSTRQQLATARAAAFGDPVIANIAAAVVSMGLLVAFIAQLQLRRQRIAVHAAAPGALMGLTLVVLLVCINPISSPRFVCGTVYLALAASLGMYANIRRFRVMVMLAPLVILYIFPIADLFRREDPQGPAQVPDTGIVGALTSGDFDSYSQITNAVHYVNVNGLQDGQQLLGALLFWVPRSMWPGKPVDSGILLGEFRNYSFTNLSAPLVSELYLDGGWILLVIGMGVLGWWVCRLDRTTEIYLAATGNSSIVATVVPFYGLLILRGSLLQSMSYLAVILASAYFVNAPPSAPRRRGDRREPRPWTFKPARRFPSLRR